MGLDLDALEPSYWDGTWRKFDTPESDTVPTLIAELRAAREEVASLRRDLGTVSRLLDCRAGRLILRNTPFLVVKCSTPYAAEVAQLIKREQVARGDWSDDDQAWMNAALGTGWDVAAHEAGRGKRKETT